MWLRVSDPDPVFCLGPDTVFKFLWFRIRIRIRKSAESYLLEENLKIVTKDRKI